MKEGKESASSLCFLTESSVRSCLRLPPHRYKMLSAPHLPFTMDCTLKLEAKINSFFLKLLCQVLCKGDEKS